MNPFEVFVVGAIVLLVAFELRDGGFRRRLALADSRLRRNLLYLAASLLSLTCVRLISNFTEAHSLALVRWSGNLPLQLVCCFLVVEMLGWLLHYVKHVNGWLWTFHFQHHREQHFDIWLSTHTHALEVVVSTIVIAATAGLLGFAPLVTEIYVAAYTVVKVYQHSARRYTLGPLDYLIVGPAYHRLHHVPGSSCNYAVTLTVFDVLLGTARWPSHQTRDAAVGIDEAELPFGFWSEMTLFLRRRR